MAAVRYLMAGYALRRRRASRGGNARGTSTSTVDHPVASSPPATGTIDEFQAVVNPSERGANREGDGPTQARAATWRIRPSNAALAVAGRNDARAAFSATATSSAGVRSRAAAVAQ